MLYITPIFRVERVIFSSFPLRLLSIPPPRVTVCGFFTLYLLSAFENSVAVRCSTHTALSFIYRNLWKKNWKACLPPHQTACLNNTHSSFTLPIALEMAARTEVWAKELQAVWAWHCTSDLHCITACPPKNVIKAICELKYFLHLHIFSFS